MKVFKDTYFIKNKETEEILYRAESFEEILSHLTIIINEFKKLIISTKSEDIKKSSPIIKKFIEDNKAIYENTFIFRPYTNDMKTKVWGFLMNGFKHTFAESRPYYNNYNENIRALYFRLGSSLADKAFIKISGRRGLEQVKELGVEYVAANFYDKRMSEFDALLSIEQLNLILLVQDKENPIIQSHIEINELHNDFVINGLI